MTIVRRSRPPLRHSARGYDLYAALYPLVPFFQEEFGLSKSTVGSEWSVRAGVWSAAAGRIPGLAVGVRSPPSWV